MPNVTETLKDVDARRRRGSYLIVTANGTRYYVEVHKSAAGGMRVISDGSSVRMLREGLVGSCGCSYDEPIIEAGRKMHLTAPGYDTTRLSHIVITSTVKSIDKIEDGAIDALICATCHRGYKPVGQQCHLCRN